MVGMTGEQKQVARTADDGFASPRGFSFPRRRCLALTKKLCGVKAERHENVDVLVHVRKGAIVDCRPFLLGHVSGTF
jgi:hypothetical protein